MDLQFVVSYPDHMTKEQLNEITKGFLKPMPIWISPSKLSKFELETPVAAVSKNAEYANSKNSNL